MAENLSKLNSFRAGYRAHLTKTLKRAKNMEKGTPTELDVVSLTNIVEQLVRKKTILTELDGKITALLKDPGEIEQEIFDSEEIQDEIDETKSQISRLIDLSVSGKNLPPSLPSHQEVTIQSIAESPNSKTLGHGSETPSNSSSSSPQLPIPQSITQPLPNVQNTPAASSSSCLPKLNLPTFTGNLLQWFTFWDSFEAAFHCNTTLGGVQKFSYLKAQLVGEASRAIAGFPLTNSNYEQAVKLLKKRFGQPSKIISAHMHALLDIASPTYHLSNLQLFYDTMENHVRGLESLGRSHETYGDLLVPIILGKLPHELRRNLAWEHDNPEWKFQELRESILKEIRILEAGPQLKPTNGPPYSASPTVTSSFHTQTQGNKSYPPRCNKLETPKRCVYCKGPHPSYNCNVITDRRERWAIIKGLGYCFNCLGNHKSSMCQSRYRCHTCKGKHHTSLCLGPNVTTHSSQTTTVSTAPIHSPQNLTGESANHVHASLVPINPAVNLPVNSGQISLLKTAVATVSHNHTHCEANILFDEGAQRSFIIQTLADQLSIPYTESESIALSAFGAHSSSNRQLPVATVKVATAYGEEVPVRVLVVE